MWDRLLVNRYQKMVKDGRTPRRNRELPQTCPTDGVHPLAWLVLYQALSRTTSVAVVLVLMVLACSKSPSTPDVSYMVTISPALGSIADARDTFQNAQLNRSSAIAGLATHLNPETVKSAIAAETDALADLITSLTEAKAMLGNMSPPSKCADAHRMVIDALDKEREGWRQLAVWYDSSGDDSLQVNAYQTLGVAGEMINQSADMALACGR